MLIFYYAAAARLGRIATKQGLQIPQGFTANRRPHCYLNLRRRRIEHPFWQLLQAYARILINPASENPFALLS